MFTGIVREIGQVLSEPTTSGRGGQRLRVGFGSDLGGRLEIGASLAVDGVCLTVVELDGTSASVELSPETLRRTRLGALRRSEPVNLEPALRLGDALGGHWVQGHVDGVLRLLERRDLSEHRELTFSLPGELAPYLVEKGSVAIDGVSLTVARRHDDRFRVALVPHTLAQTTLGVRRVGDRVHCEVDILAKYVEQLLRRTQRPTEAR